MTENQRRVIQSLKSADHVKTAIPRIVIPSQSSVGMTQLIIFCDMKLVRGPNKWSIIGKIDLHNAESRCVTRWMVEGYALEKVKLWLVEGIPLQLFQEHIMS